MIHAFQNVISYVDIGGLQMTEKQLNIIYDEKEIQVAKCVSIKDTASCTSRMETKAMNLLFCCFFKKSYFMFLPAFVYTINGKQQFYMRFSPMCYHFNFDRKDRMHAWSKLSR